MADQETLNILILGGSYSGISTAHYLLKHVLPKLPNPSSYQVILVSASSSNICRPGCPRAIISENMFPEDKFFVPIAPQFEEYPPDRFRFIHATATDLDHENRTVTLSTPNNTTDTISYHALVIATGVSTSSPLFSLNTSDTDTLKKHWTAFRTALPNAKNIIIAGGGPTGVETAGELGEYLNGKPGWFSGSLTNPKVPITLVTSAPELLPLLRPSIAHKAENLLAKVGVSVMKNTRVIESTPPQTPDTLASPVTVKLQDGRTLQADLYIPAIGYIPNTGFVRETLLAADARVAINTSTFRVEKAGERVYAIGDVAATVRLSIPNITQGIPVLCANIKRDLLLASGEAVAGGDRIFKEDLRETQLVPIGKSGVGAVFGFQVPSFLVWFIKGRDYWLGMSNGFWSGKQWLKEA